MSILNASGVGVMIAAIINIITIAYLYFFLKIRWLIVPILVKIKLKTGI